MLSTITLAFGVMIMPILWIAIDLVAYTRTGRGTPVVSIPTGAGVHDFALLVPIYGSTRYLENFDYLEQYGHRVVLCTTASESEEFLRDLSEIAERGGFQILIAGDARPATPDSDVQSKKRSTASSKRDTVIRAALEQVTADYVICIDADTSTSESLDALVAEFVERDLDFASIHLVVSNRKESLVTRLQAHEYSLAMKLRRVCPWLVSGACHIGRTAVHREVMRRHSLFFQGNDVEAGLLAEQLGYRVGHIHFEVPTAVPATLRALLRQRYAWVGGEFRLFVVNFKYARCHPWFYAYGLVFVIMLFPFRWMAVVNDSKSTLVVLFAIYVLAISALCWRQRDFAVLIMPLYTLMFTMLVVPLGAVSYVQMARASRNKGRIQTKSPKRASEAKSRLFEAPAFRDWLRLQESAGG